MDLKACHTLSYGLYVVTSRAGDRHNGQIVNTAFQVTSKPLRIVVSINKDNLTHEYIEHSGQFAVSVLAADAPMTLIGTFGFKSGRDTDKFSRVSHRAGRTGCRLIREYTVAFLEAAVVDSVDLGTHTLFIGDVVDAGMLNKGEPMTYAYYHLVKGGKTPEKAATFIDESKEALVPEGDDVSEAMSEERFRCAVCGYAYDPSAGVPDSGVPAGTPFDALPGDWGCPVCGAPRELFDKE